MMSKRVSNFWGFLGICFLLTSSPPKVFAQPESGDIFREHVWLPTMVKEKEKFLRVGGKLDYQIAPQHMPPEHHENGFLTIPDSIDLAGATRIEVIFEMVQSHDDTKGLAIQINSHNWLAVPPLEHVPQPQSKFMLHSFPLVEIPLHNFHQGLGNQFRLRVDSIQRWNWPQNIFYGLIFRVYYDQKKMPADEVQIDMVSNQSNNESTILFSLASRVEKVARVDYVGKYLDYNFEGDGVYHQWHGHPHRGILRNHIGGSETSPFLVPWNTSWLPDQPETMRIMARVTYHNGLIVMSEAVDAPKLDRSYSVELCRPYHQPENWVTRADTFQSKFSVHGNLDDALAYQVAWRSWSPCYGQGVKINGHQIWEKEDPCYGYAEHRIETEDTEHLTYGENTVETGMTPLHDGKMVHGMEVQYPGIMVKVKYTTQQKREGVSIEEGIYQNRPHFIVLTPSAIYYYDRSGGGFSRLIDRDGIDWIDFKMQPWGEYPAAAASAFRGVPNFVHGSANAGAGHPGHDQCVSRVASENEIITESLSGSWRWRWRFYPEYASVETLTVDPDHPYWFLYEGVPGGRFDPGRQYFGANSMDAPADNEWDYYAGDKLFAHFNWAYFGHENLDRILFVKQLRDDQASDTFSYLGNSERGIDSNDGMVVFGFGRADGAKPLLTDPNTFYLGLLEQGVSDADDHKVVREYLEKIH